MAERPHFRVATPLGIAVRCSRSYWAYIVEQKHPVLAGREKEIQLVLRDPDQIRRSRKESDVLLFYRAENMIAGFARW